MDNTLHTEIFELLEEKVVQFNRPDFIEDDPIQIPHQFIVKEDIEIAGFLTAAIAWGNRKAIIKSAQLWMKMLDHSPYDFVMNATEEDYNALSKFYYRTFNGVDTVCFLKSLKHIYQNLSGLEGVFKKAIENGNGITGGLSDLHKTFFIDDSPLRTRKHLANINKGASCKRLNMFLRWMVRNDEKGVDFGLWQSIHTKDLFLPLDVHTGNISRKLGLLKRKANDWKSVEEITKQLRVFDPIDPIKYDFALFGMGVEKFFD